MHLHPQVREVQDTLIKFEKASERLISMTLCPYIKNVSEKNRRIEVEDCLDYQSGL